MAKQVKSDDIMSLLDKMSDEQIEAAADELHAFVAHRRSTGQSGAQRAPMPAKDAKGFFKNFLKVVQAILPVIGPLVGLSPANPSTPLPSPE